MQDNLERGAGSGRCRHTEVKHREKCDYHYIPVGFHHKVIEYRKTRTGVIA